MPVTAPNAELPTIILIVLIGSGLGFQVKVLKIFNDVFASLGSGGGGMPVATPKAELPALILIIPIAVPHRLLYHSTLGLRVLKKKKRGMPVTAPKAELPIPTLILIVRIAVPRLAHALVPHLVGGVLALREKRESLLNL